MIVFLSFPAAAQSTPDSNLKIFMRLADRSAVHIKDKTTIDLNDYRFELNLADDYKVFTNTLLKNFPGVSTMPGTSSEKRNIFSYAILSLNVKYGPPMRKTVFGSYYVERTVSMTGNYTFRSGSTVYDEFSLSEKDTILYDDIEKVENPSLPFTTGDVPEEPLFPGILEPVALLASAAAAVFLFFTVRSK